MRIPRAPSGTGGLPPIVNCACEGAVRLRGGAPLEPCLPCTCPAGDVGVDCSGGGGEAGAQANTRSIPGESKRPLARRHLHDPDRGSASVGASAAVSAGASVGASVGALVGASVGASVVASLKLASPFPRCSLFLTPWSTPVAAATGVAVTPVGGVNAFAGRTSLVVTVVVFGAALGALACR